MWAIKEEKLRATYTIISNLTISSVLLEPVVPEISFTSVLCFLHIKKDAIDTATQRIPTSIKPPSVRFNGIAEGGAGAGVLIMFQ